jgi:triosephosphate isomerase
MTDRKPIIAGNWKMNKTHLDAIALVRTLSYELGEQDYERAEVVVCPPFSALRSVQLVLEEEHIPIALGAQDMHWEESGAFTGEVSGPMLESLHCAYVIIGHSERRALFGETDETVNRKLNAAYRHGLTPIFCVGETLEQREAGETDDVVGRQVREGLAGIERDKLARIVLAYEPVWAIGTGRAATPEDADATTTFLRGVLNEATGAAAAARIRIQYGGSVSAGNISSFMALPNVDGALVGGASLEPKSFAMIVRF